MWGNCGADVLFEVLQTPVLCPLPPRVAREMPAEYVSVYCPGNAIMVAEFLFESLTRNPCSASQKELSFPANWRFRGAVKAFPGSTRAVVPSLPEPSVDCLNYLYLQ